MDGISDFDLESLVNSIGIDAGGGFSKPRAQHKRQNDSKLIHVNEKSVDCTAVQSSVSTGGRAPSTGKFEAILCGRSSSGLEYGVFHGSWSIDGSIRSFWRMNRIRCNIHGNPIIRPPMFLGRTDLRPGKLVLDAALGSAQKAYT